MAARRVPDAGDVVWLEFDPQAGHEQSGHRPALVISPAAYNGKTGKSNTTAIVIYVVVSLLVVLAVAIVAGLFGAG